MRAFAVPVKMAAGGFCGQALVVFLLTTPVASGEDSGVFGDVFAWGASTSAFRTEGAWNVDGTLLVIVKVIFNTGHSYR